MNPFLAFHRPTMTERHVEAVAEALRSGWLTQAGKVAQFEKEFALAVRAEYAVAVNSCTAALHLALLAMGIGPGDEVITSPITFASAVNVIEHVRAIPVFADIREEDLTLDPESVRVRRTPRTRLIIATHLAGNPAAMEELEPIGIPILSDSAHAIETAYRGRPSGTLGVASCYSFYATKNITTGEGGMLVTGDPDLADRVRRLRLHGMTKDAWARYGPGGYRHWDITEPGWKYNMSDIQAALGCAQLEDLGRWHDRRRALWYSYRDQLPGFVRLVEGDPASESAYHLMVVRVPKRDLMMDEIQRRGVGVGVHFRAVHRLAYYRHRYPHWQGLLPVAEKASEEVLSLPLYPLLDEADVARVVKVLVEAERAVRNA